MEQTGLVAGWVDRLDEMAVEVTDAQVRAGLGVQPPTVRALVDGLDPPFVGQLGCRPFYRGADAHTAVAVMGLYGSMLGACRLLVTYEHADMALAWEDPAAASAPTGLVVVDAARDPGLDPAGGHTIRWHPVLFTEAPLVDGRTSMLAHWGPPAHYPGGRLPPAVAQLLAVWREPRDWYDRQLLEVLSSWEQSGYTMRWVNRPDGERNQPAWMRLLVPIM